VKLQPIKKLCIEKYEDFPELGRFAVRDMSRTSCVGIVKDLEIGKDLEIEKSEE
jgi:elongation factor 1-alpha